MTTKKLLELQLKRLLSSIAEHGSQHLSEIEADLVQTNFLLAEAIEKLNGNFMAIHASICKQQELLDLLSLEKITQDEASADLHPISVEIGRHVNAVVTGMQFEDMTNQLIGRALQRIAGLNKVLEPLQSSSFGSAAKPNIEEIVTRLNDINHSFEQQSGKLKSDLWKTVCQTHMESGDIELF